jgi:CrcB protein
MAGSTGGSVSPLVSGLLVVGGAALGAPARYAADVLVHRAVGRRWPDARFPYGTLTVNVAGSFVLGLVAALVADGSPAWWLTLAGTGFCGALTTFSSFGYQTVALLASDGGVERAAANVGVSLVLGFAACSVGWFLG